LELNFELLEKPLLHNYARFTTELDFWKIINNSNKLVDDYYSDEFDRFRKKLVYFILDSSTTIKKLDCTALTFQCISSSSGLSSTITFFSILGIWDKERLLKQDSIRCRSSKTKNR
ncbi:10491_t:CDS:2, partial [Entrophospora sp. SA101]